MRIQQLLKQPNQRQLTASFVKGHTNGIVLTVKPEGTDTLNESEFIAHIIQFLRTAKVKIKYVSDKVTTVCQNIPLIHFSDLTDIEHGTNNVTLLKSRFLSAKFHTAIEDGGLDADGVSDAKEGLIGLNNLGFSTYIDLGSIFVDQGNEVHITIESDTLSSAAYQSYPPTVAIYSISKELEPAHIFTYDMDTDYNEMHQNVINTYLCNSDISQAIAGQINNASVLVDTTTTQYETDVIGLAGANGIFSRQESETLYSTIPLFSSLNMIPEDVHVKVIDEKSDSVKYTILNKRVQTSVKDFVKGESERENQNEKLIEKVERDQPELATVLKATEIIKED